MRRTQKNLWYLKMQRRAFQNKQPKVFVYLQEMYIMVFHVTDNLSFSYTPPNFCLVVYFFFYTLQATLGAAKFLHNTNTKRVYETTLYYLVSLCIYLVGNTFYLPSILSSPLPFLYWNFCRKLPWRQHSQHFSFVLPRIEIVLGGNTNANEVSSNTPFLLKCLQNILSCLCCWKKWVNDLNGYMYCISM